MTRAIFMLLVASAAAWDTSVAGRPAPSSLPVCANEKDPLSALCRIGADAPKARFECKKPEPLVFCNKYDEWTCRYMAFAGETAPPVTYHARFDHKGPPVQTGVILDMSNFRREGKIRGVAIHVVLTDETHGKQRVDEIGKKLLAWGCAAGKTGYRNEFHCGSWDASVGYNNIIHQVIVEAAETGYLECR